MPSAAELKVWLDFVCPFCLLAEKPLNKAIDGLNVRVEWLPFELRPHPTPTLRPEGEYLQSVWRRAVYPAAARMGIPIRLPDVSPQPYTRLAFEGLQFAKEHGRADEYVDAVLRAFFQQSLDIGRLDVLSAIARQTGLPVDAFESALQDTRYANALDKAVQATHDLGIRAVPTILVGSYRIEGIPEANTLRNAIVRELAAHNDADVPAGKWET